MSGEESAGTRIDATVTGDTQEEHRIKMDNIRTISELALASHAIYNFMPGWMNSRSYGMADRAVRNLIAEASKMLIVLERLEAVRDK